MAKRQTKEQKQWQALVAAWEASEDTDITAEHTADWDNDLPGHVDLDKALAGCWRCAIAQSENHDAHDIKSPETCPECYADAREAVSRWADEQGLWKGPNGEYMSYEQWQSAS